MCGIAGAVSLDGTPPLERSTLERMLTILRHRGPEEAGAWYGDAAVLGHARLSIVDLDGGLQPIPNEDGTVWVVVNGEVFNHVELRAELRAAGHRFRSGSDSEVILHLYEDLGPALLERLNGQYAFALWDERRQCLLLGRDRLGVRPLFYTVVDGCLLFASEVKALVTDPRVPREPDLVALEQVFTYWAPLPGRTMFRGVEEVPPGSYVIARRGVPTVDVRQYWALQFDGSDGPAGDDHAERLRELLVDATRLRLRADVPVGAYLSGGLDSSAIAAIAARETTALQTFSVAFHDERYDERAFQEQMARALHTEHHVIECGRHDIGDVFPEVIWHTETPILRTAPAPLFILSSLVRRAGLKVVLTGEGADEVLAGYDIFKEALVRRFWARRPDSSMRPLLLRRLYGTLPGLQRSPAYLEAFFRQGLTDVDDPLYSHLLRWRNTGRLTRLLSEEVRWSIRDHDRDRELHGVLGDAFEDWDALSKAQYIEARTFLSPYLLSSQGDRVAMAHSVEGRFPFLDHRVIELATAIPSSRRMVGLREKQVLKHAVADLLPPSIVQRTKQPYRAPVSSAFCGPDAPGYLRALLAPDAVRSTGLFDPGAVSGLLAKAQSRTWLSEIDEMALIGVLSTQLWHQQFVSTSRPTVTTSRTDVVPITGDGHEESRCTHDRRAPSADPRLRREQLPVRL